MSHLQSHRRKAIQVWSVQWIIQAVSKSEKPHPHSHWSNICAMSANIPKKFQKYKSRTKAWMLPFEMFYHSREYSAFCHNLFYWVKIVKQADIDLCAISIYCPAPQFTPQSVNLHFLCLITSMINVRRIITDDDTCQSYLYCAALIVSISFDMV